MVYRFSSFRNTTFKKFKVIKKSTLLRDFDRRWLFLRLLKKLPLLSDADSSFLVALNWAVANSSALALFGIIPFWTSWLFRPIWEQRSILLRVVIFIKIAINIQINYNEEENIMNVQKYLPILKTCQDPTTPLCRVSTTRKTSPFLKHISPLFGWS